MDLALNINLASIKQLDTILKRINGEIDKNTRSLNLFNKSISSSVLEMKKLHSVTENVYGSISKIDKKTSFSNLKSGLKSVRKDFKSLDDEIDRTFNSLNKKLDVSGKKMRSGSSGRSTFPNWVSGGIGTSVGGVHTGFGVGNLLNANPITAAIAAGVIIAVKNFKIVSSFDKESQTVAAMNGLTPEQNKAYRKSVLNLTSDSSLGMSPTDMVKQDLILARAGIKQEDLSYVSPVVSKYAKANELTPDQAANMVVSSLFQFYKGDSKFARTVADNLSYAANKSNTSPEQLQEAMKNVGPVSSSFGNSFDLTLAMAMLNSQSGRVGGMSGTHLKIIQERLYAPKTAARKSLNELGVSTYDSSGNARSLIEVLYDYKRSTSGLSAEKQNLLAKDIFGSNATGTIKSLLDNIDELTKTFVDLKINSSGFNDELAKARTDTLSQKVDNMGNAWDNMVLSLEDGTGVIASSLKWSADVITGALNKIATDNKGRQLNNPVISRGIATFMNVPWFFGGMDYGPFGYTDPLTIDRKISTGYHKRLDEDYAYEKGQKVNKRNEFAKLFSSYQSDRVMTKAEYDMLGNYSAESKLKTKKGDDMFISMMQDAKTKYWKLFQKYMTSGDMRIDQKERKTLDDYAKLYGLKFYDSNVVGQSDYMDKSNKKNRATLPSSTKEEKHDKYIVINNKFDNKIEILVSKDNMDSKIEKQIIEKVNATFRVVGGQTAQLLGR